MPKIIDLHATDSYVDLKLDNGVTVSLAINPCYVHLQFGGIAPDTLVAAPFAHGPGERLKLSNFVDVCYSPGRVD